MARELDKEISKLENNRIVTRPFKNVEDLKKEVKEAVINLLSEKFKDYIEIEKSIFRLISDNRIEIIKPKPLQSEYIGVPRINPFEQRYNQNPALSPLVSSLFLLPFRRPLLILLAAFIVRMNRLLKEHIGKGLKLKYTWQ